MYRCGPAAAADTVLAGAFLGGSGRPFGAGAEEEEAEVGGDGSLGARRGGLGFAWGGPTGTIREPNSTPMVTSWWATKRPSQRRMVKEDLPHPESPMHTSLAMKSQDWEDM